MTSKQFQVFNCGEYITEISNSLSEQSKKTVNNGLLLNKEEVNSKVLSKITQLYKKTNKSFIVEGFPKNLQQAISLQHSHLPPTKVIFMNVNDEHLRQICYYKISTNFPSLSRNQMETKATFMVIEYKNNLKQLKEFYNNFSEIDLSRNSSEQYIIQQLHRSFDRKTISLTPRTCSHVLIIGAPNSGRTQLAKKFAKFYNLVYISTKALISNEIRKDTVTGRKIKQAFLANQLIDEFTIQKLIQDRIVKTDCLMQGFVLEGYPKNQEQYENMKSMQNLRPTLTVVIDLDSQQSIRRGEEDLQGGKKRFEKWLNFRQNLQKCQDKMYWVDPNLNEENIFEQVKYEFEKKN